MVNNVVWKKTSRTDRIEFNYIYSKGIKVALTFANFWFFQKYVGREYVFIHRQEPNQSLILAADFIMRCSMNTLSRLEGEVRERDRDRPLISHLIIKSAASKGD